MREDQSTVSESKLQTIRSTLCNLLHYDRHVTVVSREDLGEGTGQVAETVGLSEPTRAQEIVTVIEIEFSKLHRNISNCNIHQYPLNVSSM